jgi:hypothetical protein
LKVSLQQEVTAVHADSRPCSTQKQWRYVAMSHGCMLWV